MLLPTAEGEGRRVVLLGGEPGSGKSRLVREFAADAARAPAAGRVLLFATFRDTEAEVPERLSQTLADLRRADDLVRLRLGGLSSDEVSEFVRRVAEGGTGADLPELARAISELTGGNA